MATPQTHWMRIDWLRDKDRQALESSAHLLQACHVAELWRYRACELVLEQQPAYEGNAEAGARRRQWRCPRTVGPRTGQPQICQTAMFVRHEQKAEGKAAHSSVRLLRLVSSTGMVP